MPWFAIRTRRPFEAEKALGGMVSDLFFPTEEGVALPGKKPRVKALIPSVLFIFTDAENAMELEAASQSFAAPIPPFWIYRYPNSSCIQPINPRHIALLRLITAPEGERCEIFRRDDLLKGGERVRVTAGLYAGYEGVVKRVRKNNHVLVSIEGICMVMLPYIPAPLLEPLKAE